ncbi:MAG: XRE family transcriptional regulator [Acidobacteriaceae bacterium]|nr:XRE family transcriptional regulator [Acidobacteriaceae bacterium]
MPEKSTRSIEDVTVNQQTAQNSAPDPAVVAKPHLLRLDVAVTAAGEDAEQTAVTPEAAEAFIEGKRIGERIKYLRTRKSMGLVELGRHTGLSASFLSQLETGRVVPTLRNLARIAMVFSKDLSYFFEPERPESFRILRSKERQRQPQSGTTVPAYFFESLGQIPGDVPVTPYVTEFLPVAEDAPTRPHQYVGAEFLYVLAGRLEICHQGRAEVIEEGDAVYFHADASHRYRSLDDKPCTALILTMPDRTTRNNGNGLQASAAVRGPIAATAPKLTRGVA